MDGWVTVKAGENWEVMEDPDTGRIAIVMEPDGHLGFTKKMTKRIDETWVTLSSLGRDFAAVFRLLEKGHIEP